MAKSHVNRQITQFVGEVERLFNRDQLETFWDCEKAFRALIHSGVVSELFNEELRALVADPAYFGDWRPNQLMVHRGRSFAVAVSLFEKPRRYIHTTPFLGMYAPLGTSVLRYDLFRLPQNYRNELFDPSLRIERIGSGAIAAGEVLNVHSNEYVYDFKLDTPLLVFKFTSAPFQALEWLFNKETLHAWQANDAELSATQMRVAAYVMGRLAHQSSLEPLEQLSTHPHHAVRWAAIQNLGRLSRTAAMAKLEKALDDPHPHIRRAAAKTLQQLGAPKKS